MKTSLFIPAKSTSSRIKNKNLVIFDGDYLFRRKVMQMLECKEVDEVWLDSDSPELHALVSDLPIKHLHRDKALADNNTDGHKLFANECSVTDADIIVQVLCTSPFLTSEHVDQALVELKKSNKTSLVGVSKCRVYQWGNEQIPLYGTDVIPNSIDLPEEIHEAMNLYAVVRPHGEIINKRFTRDVLLYELDTLGCIDINTPEDLTFANYISAGIRSIETQKLNSISRIINSCLISDVCKELGIQHYLGNKIRPITSGRFLGFSKTLKLRSMNHEEDDWKDIFKALNSYDFIYPGDVIVVSTDIPDKAYFGDLNATFAHQRGAVGCVVDGYTRDVTRVKDIGIPVFGHGLTPDDIRYEGTFEAMNSTVEINDVCIENNDIIFGDADGVVCIPRRKWTSVLDAVKTSLYKESSIKLSAAFGKHPVDVLDEIGLF